MAADEEPVVEPSGTFFLRNKKVEDPLPAMATWVTLGDPHPHLGPSCSLGHLRPHSHPAVLMTPSVTHHWCPLLALDLSPGNVSPLQSCPFWTGPRHHGTPVFLPPSFILLFTLSSHRVQGDTVVYSILKRNDGAAKVPLCPHHVTLCPSTHPVSLSPPASHHIHHLSPQATEGPDYENVPSGPRSRAGDRDGDRDGTLLYAALALSPPVRAQEHAGGMEDAVEYAALRH